MRMKNITKLISSVVLFSIGIWLLLPQLPVVKPFESFFINLVWWPYLVSFLKGVVPLILLSFGVLLFWIEYDELRASGVRSHENEELTEEKESEDSIEEMEEDELPSFEDVEYKDLECPECGEDFKTDIGLKVHRKVNHPDEYEKNPEPAS